MTSVADLVVTHIDTHWDPAVSPKPKIMKVIAAPIEKQLGESVLVEVLSSRDDSINEEYADEYTRAMVRIYTNKGDTRLTDLGNEVVRIFSNFVVSGFDRNILSAMDDVSQRQGNSGFQVRTLDLVRLSVYRGTPLTGTPPTYEDIREATFVTIDSETTILPYSQQHVNIQEANKHTPKQHELGGDRHLQTQPLTLTQQLTVQNNATIIGNLTVQGTQTSVESTATQIKDNVITLNKGEGGAGITLGFGGIELDRGSLSYAQILFDEANDRFVFRYGDATRIPLDILSLLVGGTEIINSARKLTGLASVDEDLFLEDTRKLKWSDVNLYRSAADILKTDDNLDALSVKLGSYKLTSLIADDKVPDSDKLDGFHSSDLDFRSFHANITASTTSTSFVDVGEFIVFDQDYGSWKADAPAYTKISNGLTWCYFRVNFFNASATSTGTSAASTGHGNTSYTWQKISTITIPTSSYGAKLQIRTDNASYTAYISGGTICVHR
jgi:hypothetical protein